MAFKDVFKGFFAYEDEEVYVEEQSDKVREPAQKRLSKKLMFLKKGCTYRKFPKTIET